MAGENLNLLFDLTAMTLSNSDNEMIQRSKKQLQSLLSIIKDISCIDFKLLSTCFDEVLYPDAKAELDKLTRMILAVRETLETDIPGPVSVKGRQKTTARLIDNSQPRQGADADVNDCYQSDDFGRDKDDELRVKFPDLESVSPSSRRSARQNFQASSTRRKIGTCTTVTKDADRKDETTAPGKTRDGERINTNTVPVEKAPDGQILNLQTTATMGKDVAEVFNVELTPYEDKSESEQVRGDTIKSEQVGEEVAAEGQKAVGKMGTQKLFMCEECGIAFATKLSLRRHRRAHDADSLTCKDCGKQFTIRGKLNKHVCHYVTAKHVCSMCGKKFRSQQHLKKHMIIHTGVRKRYICQKCDMSFCYVFSLARHQLLHSGKRPYLCSFCGKRYIQKISLTTHIAIHHKKDKPFRFKCGKCGRSYMHRTQLHVHTKNAHNENRIRRKRYKFEFMRCGERYQCIICGKTYASKLTLKNHMDWHAGTRHTCSICNKSFGSEFSLTRHMSCHEGKKPHACHICNRTFSQKAGLKQHMWTHRAEKRFYCQLCEKGFNEKRAILLHSRSHGAEYHATLKHELANKNSLTAGDLISISSATPLTTHHSQTTAYTNAPATTTSSNPAGVAAAATTTTHVVTLDNDESGSYVIQIVTQDESNNSNS